MKRCRKERDGAARYAQERRGDETGGVGGGVFGWHGCVVEGGGGEQRWRREGSGTDARGCWGGIRDGSRVTAGVGDTHLVVGLKTNVSRRADGEKDNVICCRKARHAPKRYNRGESGGLRTICLKWRNVRSAPRCKSVSSWPAITATTRWIVPRCLQLHHWLSQRSALGPRGTRYCLSVCLAIWVMSPLSSLPE